MDIQLVVTEPFSGFAKGDTITDAKQIKDILAGENADKVVKTTSTTEAPASK